MTGSADDRIMWLAGLLCRPTRREAAHAVTVRAKATAGFDAAELLQNAGTLLIDDRNERLREFGNRVRATDPVLALAFEMIALSTDDSAATAHIVPGAIGLLCSADGDTSEARARLRVWDDVPRGKYIGDDFFELAEIYWRGEMRFVVASKGDRPVRDRFSHPALQALMFRRWDDAFGWLHAATEAIDVPIKAFLDAPGDRAAVQAGIIDLVEQLYASGTTKTGAMALAWSMLTADPRQPHTFSMLPQLQCAIDHDANLDPEDDAALRARIRIWWRAAEAEWTDSEVSIFRIAEVETAPDDDLPDDREPELHPQEMTASTSATLFADLGLPTLVVMPESKASKLNHFHAQYKDLVDAPLPLVVAHDVPRMRSALHAEFPHATMAVDLLLRDLREGRPFWLKPVLLVGGPGAGKSRLVRRVADLVRNLYVYRFDAASSSDSHFGGTSKAWSNTEPSVPFRAVAQGKIANPVVLIDEIDKASKSTYHGRLVDSILPFCDVETARRYRDQSLDCEIDISMCSFIATANDATELPSPLKDRFRFVKVPSPTLADLPALAGQVMRDLAIEDEARSGDAPLAGDELAVIAKAWQRAGFSMRKLQKIVGATLEARDSYAPRH